jgi:hypothetical protein
MDMGLGADALYETSQFQSHGAAQTSRFLNHQDLGKLQAGRANGASCPMLRKRQSDPAHFACQRSTSSS